MRGDGSSNEERLRTGRSYRTDRTEGISDGVFAVSLTLLILDVRPPEGGVSRLVHGLVLIVPRLGTFALSFAIVAYYRLVHHLIFASLRLEVVSNDREMLPAGRRAKDAARPREPPDAHIRVATDSPMD